MTFLDKNIISHYTSMFVSHNQIFLEETMCFGANLPFGADKIAELEKGDIVSVKAGAGYPSSLSERVLTVYEVDKFSALCTDGTRLMCTDGMGVEKTGKKDPNPILSLGGYKVLVHIWLNRARQGIEDLISMADTEIWYTKYRIGRFFKQKK